MIVSLVLMTAAYAADLSVKVEPGIDIPLTAPQSDIYDIGGSQSLKLEIPLNPYLDVGPAGSVQIFPAKDGSAHGIAWGFGVGGRLKVPHEIDTKISPWLDADALYAHTDFDLSRPSFDVGVGVAVPTDKDRSVWVGPFVRYGQVVQQNKDEAFDNRDAHLLSIGFSMEVGKRLTKDPVCQACAVYDIAPIVCPNVSIEQQELRETVRFATDKTDITPEFAAKLDAIVEKIGSKDYVIVLRGHTDADGSYQYNQVLSYRRAIAVTEYLVSRGLTSTKIEKDGYSETMPVDTNATPAGKANNRRVEVVVFITQTEVK